MSESQHIYLVHSPTDAPGEGERVVRLVADILRKGGVGADRAWIDQVVGNALRRNSALRSLPGFEEWKGVLQQWRQFAPRNIIYRGRRAILQSMKDHDQRPQTKKGVNRVNWFYWSEDPEDSEAQAAAGSRIVYRIPKDEALARGVCTHAALNIYKTPWVVPMSYLVNKVPPIDNDRLLREWHDMLDTDFDGVSGDLIERSRALIEAIKAADASSSSGSSGSSGGGGADDLSAFGFRF